MKCKAVNYFYATNELLPSFLDIRPNVSDDCIFNYFRRQFPNQEL